MLMRRRIEAAVLITLTVLAIAAFQGCAPTASLVIGQPNFKVNDLSLPSGKTLDHPGGPVAVYRDSLYVTDSINNRILVFSPVPAGNYPSAAGVIESGDPSKWKNFQEPYALSIADDKMFVADAENNRVLIWNKVPAKDEKPDIVLGQADLTGDTPGDCAHMNAPRALFAAKDKLIVSESGNNRVLIWNSIPGRTSAANLVAADLILGNADCSPDNGASTRRTFNHPRGVWTDGTRLVVADMGNNRVLIWSRFPSSPSDDADIVLGTGREGSGPDRFTRPYAVASDGTRLFIADDGNSRVLIWQKFPLQNGELPSAVLGQSDFLHSGPNGSTETVSRPLGIPRAGTLANPQGLYVRNNELWVTDTNNNRILMFKLP